MPLGRPSVPPVEALVPSPPTRERGAETKLVKASGSLDPLRRGLKLAQAFVYRARSSDTVVAQLERHARKRPSHPFLRYEKEEFTYAEAAAEIERYARAYSSAGIGRGDVVALMMENRPAFLWHVFALHKISAIAALINTNLVGGALAHALQVCAPGRVVLGSELLPTVRGTSAEVQTWLRGRAWVDLDSPGSATPAAGRESEPTLGWDIWPASSARDERVVEGTQPVDRTRVPPTLEDVAAYIYTSGTTGLPKPAIIRHSRLYRAGRVWGALAFGLGRDDVLYNCLPLYHGNALMLATCSVVTFGATLALSRRFSASAFWDEVRRHRATSFVYVGELCRYLLAAPPTARDRDHQVRVVSGNGLRPDLWRDLQTRFGVHRVSEFYGATEGNCLTINVSSPVGSVGKLLPGMALARWDEEKRAFVRGPDGWLVRVRPGERGVLLGRIRGKSRFDGYRDAAEGEKKVVRGAFAEGDAWFDTGDLMRVDAKRNLYFCDRLGDTFRWKGENVSTFEVETQISTWSGARQVNVYGVVVGQTEGRAGMVAFVPTSSGAFDPVAFKAHVDAALPPFARPLFVRLVEAMDQTGTMKLPKTRLQAEGFDPLIVRDPLYFRHPGLDAYVRLTPSAHAEILALRIRI